MKTFSVSRSKFDSVMKNSSLQVVVRDIQDSPLVNLGSDQRPDLSKILGNDTVTFTALNEADEENLSALFE